jgi:hypothetical protein
VQLADPKSQKRREHVRSGVVRRTRTTRQFSNLREWAAANNLNYSQEHLAKKAEDFLCVWERAAFAVYGRHGLPTVHRVWRASPTSEWQPEPPEIPTGEFSMATIIASEAADVDSEVGFATAILRQTYDIRRELKGATVETLRAFVIAASLAQDYDALSLEFELAPLIAPAKIQADGRRQGGKTRAIERRAKKAESVRQWRAEAETLSPNLSLRARAEHIARRMKDTEFEASPETIRKSLKFSG